MLTCIASITGDMFNYCEIDNKTVVCFDGGFLSNP